MKNAIFALSLVLTLVLSFPLQAKEQAEDKREISSFAEPKGKFKVNIKPYPQRESKYFPVKASWVIFPSAVKSPIKNNNKVPAILFEPTYKKSDACIILLPWWKDRTTEKPSMIARTLVTLSGMNVLFVPMAYQFERAKKGVGSGSWTVSPNLKRTREAIIQSVKDIRRAATWLLQEKNIHPQKLGLMGISLGGFVGSLAYAIDDRFQAAVILLAGGNYKMMMKIQLAAFGSTREGKKLKKIFENKKGDLNKVIKLLDPINYAQKDRGKRVLMVNGLFDPIVPYPCGRSLKKAFGARMISLPCGHYTAVAFIPYIFSETVSHFKKHFEVKKDDEDSG